MTYWNNPDYSASKAPASPFLKTLNYFNENFIENETQFIRIYDKHHFQKEGIWMFGVAQFKQETPEQLVDILGLPFVPLYICDVFAKPHERIIMYIISNEGKASKEGKFVCQVEKGLRFVNERPLRPGIPIHQQLNTLGDNSL